MQSRDSDLILPLTSIRFLAAFYVVLLHSVMWSHHLDTSNWVGRFLRSGYTAVGFFFVLSGYILAHVYLDSTRIFSPRAFWVSRFARVYPLLFISLLLDLPHDFLARLALHGLGSAIVRSFVELISECALLQSWDGHFRNINAPSWSLSAEGIFYLLFPFVSFWIWRLKGTRALGLFILFWSCAVLAPLIATLYYPILFNEVASSKLQEAIELMPVFRMFEFFAGIAICAAHKELTEKMLPKQISRLGYLFIGLALVLFVTAIQFANHIPLLIMSNGFLLPISALAIIGLASIRGWLFWILSQRYLVILGEASYAVYLLHAPIWLYFSSVHPITSLRLWALYIGVLITASIASFFWIEKPCRKKILKWFSIRPAVILDQEGATSHT